MPNQNDSDTGAGLDSFDFSGLSYFNTPPVDVGAPEVAEEPVEEKLVGGFDLSSLSYFQDEEPSPAEAVVEKPPARMEVESPTPSAFVEEEDFPAIKVDPGVISRMSDEEAVRYLPKRMTLEPTSQEVETLHPALNTDEYYAKRRSVATAYNAARTNEERIAIMSEFTDVWMPEVLERATGKSGWKEKGLTGIATAAQWFDNITGRWVRALINTTAEDRKREIAGDGFSLRSPDAWWDEFKKEYERADGGLEGIDSDGERTMKNLYIWSRSTLPMIQNRGIDALAIGGKEFGGTGEQNLAAYEAEADNIFQFGADMVNDLSYGAGGVLAQIMPGGTDFSDYMAARKEAKAEGSIGGHEFIGFLGQMTADPALMFKMPKIAQIGGVLNTKQGASAIDELLAKEADDVIAGLSDEAAAQELPKILDGLRNEYGMKQVDAADVMFRHDLPNYYGVEAPEILFNLKNPKFSHVVDGILDRSGSTTPSRRPSRVDTTPKDEGLNLDEALAGDDIAEQSAMQTFRAEEAWVEIMRESIRRKEVPRGIDVKYQGVDAETLDDVWSGAIRWEKPAKIGKETAEQAFERSRMIHSLDNVRTKMMSGLIKKYPYLEPARRTLESIVMLEKAQPMATQIPVGDVAETRLFNIREGLRRGDLEETPEIAAEIEDLVSRGTEVARTKWTSMAPKGRARHGILHQAKFKLGEDAEKLRQLRATLSNQEAAAFFEKMKDLGADNDTMTLTLLFKELGRHEKATAGVLERVASLDRLDSLYKQAIDGDFTDLPPEYRAEMQAIADEQGYLDSWNQAVNDAEELYKAKKVSRKEAWQEVRTGMSRLRKAMKNSLGDVFAREAELRALKDAEPVRSQIAELRAWRDQFSDLIKNRVWHGDEPFDRAISRITDFRQEQSRAIDEMVMGKEGADPDKVFEGYRLKRVLPEGTPEEWGKLRDNFQFGISKVFGPESEMTDVVMAITDQRAKSWAEWNRVPEDSVNAYYAASMQGPFPVMLDLDPSDVSRLKGNVFFSRREGMLPTDTPEFKRWFGDSKIVDEAGEPLTVYHGTTDTVGGPDFAFRGSKSSGGLIYFDARPEVASEYASGARSGYMGLGGIEDQNLRKIFEEENPSLFSNGLLREDIGREELSELLFDVDTFQARELAESLDEGSLSVPEAVKRYNEGDETSASVTPAYLKVEKPYNTKETAIPFLEADQLGADFFRKAGADGVWVKEADGAAIAVFEPTQIKSTQNVGTFDPEDPRLLFSRREGDLDPLAYTKFEDGKAIIGVFKNAKGREAFTAVVEELGHIFRRDIPKQDLQVAEKWVRKQLGTDAIYKNERWTERAEEAFSKAFTKWVKTGELPEGIKKNPGLKGLFEKAKDWLLDVYLVITGKKSPKIRAIFKGFGDSPATRRKAESLKAGTRKRKPVPEISISEDLAAVFERMLDPESLRGDYSPLARELDESLEALKASDPLTSAFAFLKVQAAIRDLSQAAGKGEGEADELLADLVSRDVDRVQRANRAVDRIKMQASGRHKTAPSMDTVMAPAKSTDAAIKKALEKDLVERLGLRPDEASELVDKGYRNAKKDIKASMKQPVEEIVEEAEALDVPIEAGAERGVQGFESRLMGVTEPHYQAHRYGPEGLSEEGTIARRFGDDVEVVFYKDADIANEVGADIHLEMINTLPSGRRKGAARIALRKILEEADESGVSISLEPISKGPVDEEGLIAWYKKNGFEVVPGFDEPGEILMVRKPSAPPQRQRTKYDDRPTAEAFKDYQNEQLSLQMGYKDRIDRAKTKKTKEKLKVELLQERVKLEEEWLGRRSLDEGPAEVEIPFELGKKPRTLEQVRASKYVTKVDVSPVKGKRRYTMHVRSDVSVDGATHVIGPTVISIIEQFMKISPRKKDAPRIVSKKKKKITEQQRFHQEYPNLLKRMASDYVSKHPALARREARIQDIRSFDQAKALQSLQDLKSSWAYVRKNFNKLGDTGDVSLMRRSLSDVFDSAYGRSSLQRKSVGTDLNILLRGGERVELDRAVRRIDQAIDDANNELAMKASGEAKKGDSILQEAADVAAIKSTPASDETVQRAKDAIRWIDGQIKDRDTFVRMSLSQARKDARRVRRVVDDEEELTELGALLAGAEEGVRVVDAESPLSEAVDALAPGGMEMGPRGRVKTTTKDVVSGPEVVIKELSEDMNQILNDMPKTRESIMAAAEKMGYDLRTPGEMWNVILNAKKWSRSYGDELALRREMAIEAFKNDETIRMYEGLPRDVKGKVERLLKNRKLYGVAPDASPKIKSLAKSLGMVGSEELFITLKRGRVKVADHFTEKQIEQALEAAKLLDTLLEKQLKTMQDAGVLVGDDPVIKAKIDMLRAEQTLSRDVAEKSRLEAEIKELKNSMEVSFSKEEFLTRVGVASYVPHLKSVVARMTTSALSRGGMPSTKKGFFENQRTMASTLDDLNEQRRHLLGVEDLYHNAESMDRPAWAPGAPFHGMDQQQVLMAARNDSLEGLFSADGWEEAVNWSRENLSASGLAEFFETDFNILIERYMRESNRRVADAIHGKDIDEMFPMGDEIAKLVEGMPVGLAELRAREFGYSRLSKYDSVQAMTGIPLPSKLRFYEETILDLLAKTSPEEVVSILREKGVSVDITQIEAIGSAPTKFAPTPYVEYLRWINKPDWAEGKWWMGWLDGIHSVAKGMATISSIAHVGLNASGNHASIAQKLGTEAFNPANHADAWMITMKLSPEDKNVFFKNMGVKYEDAPITIGPHTKTVQEWRDAFDIEGVSEAPLSRAFLEEMGAQPGGRAAPQLAGSALGAASFGALGFLGAGPIGAAALGFIGQYPGALMGDIISKGLASADVKAMEGGLLSKIPAAARKGWERVSFEEMEEFRKAIDIATPKDIKNSVRYFGERAIGATASAAIGSVFGPMGSVASAIAGLSLPSYMKMMTGLNQAVETQARITLAVGEIRKGKTIKEAAMSVDDTLRNYAHLTPVEKHVLRRLFFFYTWDAGNMRFQMNNLVKNPRQAAVFSHFVNGVFKGSFNEEEIQAMPENLRWKILMKTGPSTIWAMNGLPQQAFVEMLGRWADGKPAGFLTRIRPDALAMFEFMADKQSVYYGKGWDELTNVRMLKDSNPWLKKVAGFPVKRDPNTGKWVESPGRRPIFDKDNNIVGWKKDYRAMHPERYYLMSKLPGWRLIMEQLKLQKESFTSTAMDYEDPSKRATNLQRAMSFITGNRPYSVDFDNQIKYYEWKFLEELQRQIKLQDKTFFVDIKRAVRRIPPKDGELDIPSDRITPERVEPDR